MVEELHILLVEDSPVDAELLVRFLRKNDISFRIEIVSNREAFVQALNPHKWDLIIADHTLPAFSGMDAFRIARARYPQIPFILITGSVSEQMLLQYSKEGIDDYILKDNLLRLPAAMQNVINKKKLESLYKKLHAAYQDIKDSINYGKLIQDAILPDKSVLRATFPRSFILYTPKDVLSGDFYWFERIENKFLFAVADCTGHGVPGALLAVMGNNLLNHIVAIKKISDPASVLNHLNSEVAGILRRHQSSLHDGMDIAFCEINIDTKELVYAGANRPLLIERLGNLIELKPHKMAIGGTSRQEAFASQTMKLNPGDRLFVFSDGYADQFHHDTGKKVLTKRLKQMITETSRLPITAQKKMLFEFFESWKGNGEQVDDVLLLGIEVE